MNVMQKVFNRLHIQIMLPFIILFVMISLVSTLLNRHYVSKLMDERLSRQAERVTAVLSNAQFVLNPVYITKLRDVIEGDIIVYSVAGDIVTATLDKQMTDLLSAAGIPGKMHITFKKNRARVLNERIQLQGKTFLVTASVLTSPNLERNANLLFLLFPLHDLESAKAKTTAWMFFVGIISLIMIAVSGYFLARSLTRPIQKIVATTSRIADGKFTEKTDIPKVAELKTLANAINSMSDKLIDYEKDIVQATQNAASGKVTAAMAHEIRNPLSSVKMMTQLLRNKSMGQPESERIVAALLEEINRLERIVNDLTSLTKPSGLTKKRQAIDVLLNEVLEIITPRLQHLNIAVTYDFSPSLPAINIDRDRIKQVVWNLLLNAMESMPEGGTIHIRTRLITKDDAVVEALRIVITDEGHGIEKKHLNVIFNHFHTTKAEGIGIGLSTSKNIIESHGGRLIIENRQHKGVKATIEIPYA